MIHGDLKGVGFRDPGLHFISNKYHQGQRPDRCGQTRSTGGLWFAYDHIGHIVGVVYTRWLVAVDEPGTLRSGEFRSHSWLPDEALGLLCAGDGNIRSSERENAIFPGP